MITLYQFEISPFCDKVRRILHVKAQPYEVREIPVAQAPLRLRRIHRTGKLPCIDHEGRRISDSTDIAYYLEERFPEPPLLPADPRERALVHVLEDWADESLYFYEMRLRFGIEHNARRWVPELLAHDPPWLQKLGATVVRRVLGKTLHAQGLGRKSDADVVRELDRHVSTLEHWLGDREWLVGSSLTLADIAVFAQLFCIRGAEEGAKAVGARPAVAAWMERVDRATAGPAA